MFGERAYSIPVNGTSGYNGHALGERRDRGENYAPAMTNDWLPPTLNLTNADDKCDLGCIRHVGREECPEMIFSNSAEFGGINGALVLRRGGKNFARDATTLPL